MEATMESKMDSATVANQVHIVDTLLSAGTNLLTANVYRASLLDAVELADRIADRKEFRPILRCVLLSASPDGFRVFATNLESHFEMGIFQVGDVDSSFCLAIPCHEFRDFLRASSSKFITLHSMDDKGVSTVIGDAGDTMTFQASDPSEFPEIPGFDPVVYPFNIPIQVQMDDFAREIARVSVASSRDCSRFTLQSVYLESLVKGYYLNLTATDGKRLTTSKVAILNRDIPKKISTIIPISFCAFASVVFKHLHKQKRNPSVYLTIQPEIATKTDMVSGKREEGCRGLICIKVDEITLMAIPMDGDYPNYKNALPSDALIPWTVDRKPFLQAIKAAGKLTIKSAKKRDADGNYRTLSFLKGESTVLVKTENHGEVKINLPIGSNHSPCPINFMVNDSYLLDQIESFDEKEITFLFEKDKDRQEKPFWIREGEYQHGVMPVVLKKK